MIRKRTLPALVVFLKLLSPILAFGQSAAPISSFVNPLLGGASSYACSPFGMVKLGPDGGNLYGGTVPPVLQVAYYSTTPIMGFSHTHLMEGNNLGIYGNLLVTPQFGKPNFKTRIYDNKANEAASPGYYSVILQNKTGAVNVELTANQNVGRHKYKFKKNDQSGPFTASVLIDIASCVYPTKRFDRSESECRVEADGSFRGKSTLGSAPHRLTLYFLGQVNLKSPVISYKRDTVWKGAKKIDFDTTGFAFTGEVSEGDEVELTLSISYKSYEEAGFAQQKALTSQFDDIRKKSASDWEDRLSVFTIQTAKPEEKELFYTCLYQTLLEPTDVSGNHPDDQFGEAHFWDHYSLGNVSRTVMPLHNLIYIPHQRRILNSLIRMGELKGHLPESYIAGQDSYRNQKGSNAETILAESVAKGIFSGPDAAKAWKVAYKNATHPSENAKIYGTPKAYIERGWLPSGTSDIYTVSSSIEFAANDFAMSRMATKLGKISEAEMFMKRSYGVLNLWNSSRKSFWGKDSTSKWISYARGAKAVKSINKGTTEYSSVDTLGSFECSNQWTWLLGAPHLADTLQSLLGKEGFTAMIDTAFNEKRLNQYPGFCHPVGWYLPFGYLSANQPDKTQMRIKQLLGLFKSNYKISLQPGQNRSGAVEAWLVWVYMGLFPIAGTDEYWIIKPEAESLEVNISGGKILKVSGKGAKPYWNGKELKTLKVKHADLVLGGKLEWK